MKVGSTVELVELWKEVNKKQTFEAYFGYIFPELGKHYTIRGFQKCINGLGILLEEIVNPKVMTTWGLFEIPFDIAKFREILPPLDIEALLKECEEIVHSEKLVCS